ncbi:DNA primase [Streptomyces sp. NPDC050704]|uniref:DNA primase n=1 Tax=Streptomyces sp. NPDC050704 TaxID=3157219 RepID=UPI00343E53E7
MNRLGLGLAVGAGYVLGRTKKMKLAFAVGTMVAGKRMHLSPRALADLVSQQLQNNPQFKEVGDQLREDLRGVGKAASGALVERQIEGLADRLHGRTAEVRDQLAGVVPDVPGLGEEEDDEAEARRADDEYESDEYENEESPGREEAEEDSAEDEPRSRRKAAAKKAPAKKTAERKAPAKKGPAKRAAEQKPAAKKTVAKTAKTVKTAPGKKAAAAKTSARRARTRLPKGGGGDD